MRGMKLVGLCAMALFLGTMVCGDKGDAGGKSQGNQGDGQGQGGKGDCVTCYPAFTTPTPVDPDLLCPGSADKLRALQECICQNCGAAEGDACYPLCTGEQMSPDAACQTCVQMVTSADGACNPQADAWTSRDRRAQKGEGQPDKTTQRAPG